MFPRTAPASTTPLVFPPTPLMTSTKKASCTSHEDPDVGRFGGHKITCDAN